MQVPQQLGPYRIQRELGRGGMGAVYAAHDPGTDRGVALKVLTELRDHPVAVERFLREGRAMARLSHPGIVRVYRVDRIQGMPVLAMELVEGESLQARLQRAGPLANDEARAVFTQLARAVHHAHEQGVLHRDLKPDNVLLDEHGRPRLTDFGIAKAAGEHRLTHTGTMMGTPAYMSPEQANDSSRTDPRTDVYGLGATLYAALTGQRPFVETSGISLLNAVLSSTPTLPSKLRPGVDPGLEAVCLRCLEKDPAQRFQTAQALAEALESGSAARRPAWILPVLAMGILLLGAGGGVGVALALLRPQPAPAPTPAPQPPVSEPPSPLPAAPFPVLDGLSAEQQRDHLLTWLAEHPRHAQTERARQELRRVCLQVPLRLLQHEGLRGGDWFNDHPVTGGNQDTRVWDLTSGEVIGAHPGGVGRLCSLTNDTVVTLGQGPTLQIFDPLGKSPPRVLRPEIDLRTHTRAATLLRCTAKRDRVLIGYDQARWLAVLEVPSGRLVSQFHVPRAVRRADFVANETAVAVALWDTEPPHPVEVRAVASGELLTSFDVLYQPWHLQRLGSERFVLGLQGSLIAGGTKGGWVSIRNPDGSELGKCTSKDGQSFLRGGLLGIACSSAGDRIYGITGDPAPKVHVWDGTGKLLHAVVNPGKWAHWIAVDRSGDRLLQVDANGVATVWDFSGLRDS